MISLTRTLITCTAVLGLLGAASRHALMADDSAPSLAEQVAGWTADTQPLAQRIDQAMALMNDLDAVMVSHFTRLNTPVDDQTAIPTSAIADADDARALRAWLEVLQEDIGAGDGDVAEVGEDRMGIQLRVERLAIFTELFANIAERNTEQRADDIFRLLALNLYLPHRPYPADQQQRAFALIQGLARSYPDPINFAWSQEVDDPEAATPWQLELGPRAQANLLRQIGDKRFRQVLQSLPPQALHWSVDYHGYPNALLENRLSLRIDHQRQRVVLEEVLLNLRVNTPIDEKKTQPQE